MSVGYVRSGLLAAGGLVTWWVLLEEHQGTVLGLVVRLVTQGTGRPWAGPGAQDRGRKQAGVELVPLVESPFFLSLFHDILHTPKLRREVCALRFIDSCTDVPHFVGW